MIQNKMGNEKEIRRFLLGELSENERTALEEKFLADEDCFTQIRVAEDELIEEYVRGKLENEEKEKFEKQFLSSKTRRERVIFTREMLGKFAKLNETAKKTETVAPKTSVLSSILEFFRQPKLAFGAGFAILALVFGFWFLVFRKPANETEIVRQISPTPTIEANFNKNSAVNPPQFVNENANINTNASVNSNSNSINKQDANKTDTNSEIPKKEEKQKEISANPVLALFAGTVRSEGKTNELNLPKNAQGANFQLNLESQDYQTYRAEIIDQNGNVIYRSGKLRAKNSKIYTTIPAKNLKRGDYILKLYGFNPQNEEESAADFQFRVNQK